MKKSERTLPGAELKFTNLYVKNIDPDVTEEMLTQKFSEFGKITNLIVMKDENDQPKGFGFINFENPDDAKKAVEEMNGALLGNYYVESELLDSTMLSVNLALTGLWLPFPSFRYKSYLCWPSTKKVRA
jgi:RNA recognition motif-containing protein